MIEKVIAIDLSNKPNLDDDWRSRLLDAGITKVDGDSGSDWKNFNYDSSDGDRKYFVSIRKTADGELIGGCSCPYGSRRNAKKICKHLHAALLYCDENAVFEAPHVASNDIVEAREELLRNDGLRPLNDDRVFWPSKLDLVEKCPASYIDDGELDINIDKVGAAATVGQAVHAIAQKIVEGEVDTVDREFATEIAIKYGVEDYVEDVLSLGNAALSAWSGQDGAGLNGNFDTPLCEISHRFEHQCKNPNTKRNAKIVISGRTDVEETFTIVDGGEERQYTIALDWKTGRKADARSYRAQMISYALLLFAENSSVEEVTIVIVWLRERSYSTITFKREEVREWFKTFLRRSAFWDGKTFKPGDHCSWCRRFYDCPARAKMLNSIVESVSGDGESSMILSSSGELVDPDALYRAYSQGKVLERMLKDFFAQIKEEAAKRGGIPIPGLSGDRGFIIKKRRGNAKIDPIKAWPILKDNFTDDEIAPLVSISKGKIVRAAMDKSPRGAKKKVADSIVWDLVDAGALSYSSDVKYLEVGDMEDMKSDEGGSE